MINVSDIKDVIVEAKKKYDKEKYIDVLEEQIERLQREVERMNTQISVLERNKFVLNSDHLELFSLFKNNNYLYYEEDIQEYSKKSIDLEIALNELIEHRYFERPNIVALGSKIRLHIPEDKKIEFLRALKSNENNVN